jgi:peroxiredoxin
MKNIKIFVAICYLLATMVACKNKSEAPKKGEMFTISGTINNLPYDKIYLAEYKKNSGMPIIVDSIKVPSNGEVELKAVSVSTNIYGLLAEDNNKMGEKGLTPFLLFVNDAKKIDFDYDFKNAKEYTIKNSVKSKEIRDYYKALNEFSVKLINESKKIDSLQGKSKKDSAAILQAISHFKMIQKPMSAEIVKVIEKTELESQVYLFINLGNVTGVLTEEDNNNIMEILKRKFPDSNKKGQAIDLEMMNPMGKKVKISDFKGKYTLVDFWASWCGPCRGENPNVVAAYNKFKNRNFTILGVSLDEDTEAWKTAIQQDGLTWEQMSDLKGWESAAVEAYRFNGIPYNVLISPEGDILESNLRGEDLHNYLDKVLPK